MTSASSPRHPAAFQTYQSYDAFAHLQLSPSQGRKFAQVESAEYSGTPGYAFGYFCNESIAAEEQVLVVDAEHVMSATTSADNEQLTTRLFCHASVGEASPWHTFIRSTLGKPGLSLYEALPFLPDAEALPQLSLAKRRWARAAAA